MVRAALADTAAHVSSDGVMWQHSIEAHIRAVQAWASFDEPLPPPTPSTHGVWRLVDELIMEMAMSRASRPAEEIWSQVEREYQESFVDALFQISEALNVAREFGDPLKAGVLGQMSEHRSGINEVKRLSLVGQWRLQVVT